MYTTYEIAQAIKDMAEDIRSGGERFWRAYDIVAQAEETLSEGELRMIAEAARRL